MPKLTGPDADPGDPSGVEPGRGIDNGTPRWVKVFAVVALAVVVLVVVLLLVGGGDHGPGRHAGGDRPPAGVTEGHTGPQGGHG